MSTYHLGGEEFFFLDEEVDQIPRVGDSGQLRLSRIFAKTECTSPKNMKVQRLKPSWKKGSEGPNYSLLKESLCHS